MPALLERLGFRKAPTASPKEVQINCNACERQFAASPGSEMAAAGVCPDCAEDRTYRKALEQSYVDSPTRFVIPADPVLANKKVMVVDDDRMVIRILSTRLREAGCRVVCAEDAASAISIARRETPDVVILDLGLPGGDGMTVMERLRNIGPMAFTPIIILSGQDAEYVEQKVLWEGAHAFLPKPPKMDAIVQALREALA